MNPFNVGDIVATIPSMATQRAGGIVEHLACYGATQAGGKICSYKRCTHFSTNDYVWVRFGTGLVSYIYGELMLDPAYNAPGTGAAQTRQTIPAAGVASPAQVSPSQTQAPAPASPVDPSVAAVPSAASKASDKIVAEFKKSVQEIQVNRDKNPIQPDEIDWDFYTGKKGMVKGQPGNYRKARP